VSERRHRSIQARDDLDSLGLRGLLERQQHLLADVSALASLATRSREAEWVSLHAVARPIWSDAQTGDVTLRLGAEVPILADREWVGLLLESLLENVLTHAEPAEVRIGVEDDRFYVADDGSGIPIGDRDLLLEGGVSSTPAGSGYGLSVVKHVARAHDWGLRIQESDAGGTRVELTGVRVRTE